MDYINFKQKQSISISMLKTRDFRWRLIFLDISRMIFDISFGSEDSYNRKVLIHWRGQLINIIQSSLIKQILV